MDRSALSKSIAEDFAETFDDHIWNTLLQISASPVFIFQRQIALYSLDDDDDDDLLVSPLILRPYLMIP